MRRNLTEKSETSNITDLDTVIHLINSDKGKTLIKSLFDEPSGIPISIFKSKLAPLEAVVKYLVENKGLSIKMTSKLLNRSISSLYTTYNISKRKMKSRFILSQSYSTEQNQNIILPYNLFGDRDHSILEELVSYLRTRHGFSLITIAGILSRSYSTVKTVSRRHSIKDDTK